MRTSVGTVNLVEFCSEWRENKKGQCKIVKQFPGTLFPVAGILGYDVYVDIYGDAEGNYTLLTFDTQPAHGNVELVPSGYFRMTQHGVGIPVRFLKIVYKSCSYVVKVENMLKSGTHCLKIRQSSIVVLTVIDISKITFFIPMVPHQNLENKI